jgi:hypothetical protein
VWRQGEQGFDREKKIPTRKKNIAIVAVAVRRATGVAPVILVGLLKVEMSESEGLQFWRR